jgi:hypothetical protein
MATDNLVETICSLIPEEQESVKRFIEFLKPRAASSSSPFRAAADEFIDEHPELLRGLAQ